MEKMKETVSGQGSCKDKDGEVEALGMYKEQQGS